MYRNGSEVTLGDVYGFIAKVMKTPEIAEPMRRDAAILLLASGWHAMTGTTEEAKKLTGIEKAPETKADALFVGDLMEEERV